MLRTISSVAGVKVKLNALCEQPVDGVAHTCEHVRQESTVTKTAAVE